MARYQVILTYDGADFKGMQRQAKERTVQGVVEKALGEIGWEGQSILAAGRTDAGVHASGQVIAFDFDWGHSQIDLLNALNGSLPFDLAALSIEVASLDFQPRFDALSRRYRYAIFCRPIRDPLRERYAWRVWPRVDRSKMQAAVKRLIGIHDFASYGRPPKQDGSTVRDVIQASWRQIDDILTFEIEANAFLYHMVRRIVYQQVEIGQGKQHAESITEYLGGKSQKIVQGLAPPNGLTLVEVCYPPSVE